MHAKGWTEEHIRREETAGGLPALKIIGDPGAILLETKERLFAA